jgi:hypothetical protein
VSAVTAALNEFASIATFAATVTSTTGSTSGNGVGSTNSTAAAPPDAAVVAKQNALLTTLTSVINTKDPASMSSTLNAVGAVSSSATGLSGAAGTALLDVVDGFVNANKGSKTTDISDAQVSLWCSDSADFATEEVQHPSVTSCLSSMHLHPLCGLQVKTATKVLYQGVKAAFQNAEDGVSKGRTLLQASGTGTAAEAVAAAGAAAEAAQAAYRRLTGTVTGLSALVASGTAKGTTRVAGSDMICLAVACDDVTSFTSNRIISLKCDSPAAGGASGNRRLLAAAVTPTVAMPSDFAAACAADTSCSSAGTTTISSSFINDPTNIMATVKHYPKAVSLLGNLAEAGTNVTVISGERGLQQACLQLCVKDNAEPFINRFCQPLQRQDLSTLMVWHPFARCIEPGAWLQVSGPNMRQRVYKLFRKLAVASQRL